MKIIVVGAGVIGCATAYELAKAGCAVTLLERATPGAEASGAAAGMLDDAGRAGGHGLPSTWPSPAGDSIRLSPRSFASGRESTSST